MIKDFILSKTVIPQLSKGLDVYSLRQKITSENIANIQTAGYRRKEVKFEDKLRGALDMKITGVRTNANHLPVGGQHIQQAQPVIEEDPANTLASGVNNVDIDKEMVEQVKNEIRYLYGSRLLSKNFAALRASIKGRYDR